MKYTINLYINIFVSVSLLFLSCKSTRIIELRTLQDVDVKLVTFHHFEKDTMDIGLVKPELKEKIPMDYKGFALMLLNDKYPYPLLLGKDAIKVQIESVEESPVFEHCPENQFFYDYFGKYNRLRSRIYQLHEAENTLGEKDPFIKDIDERLEEIENEKNNMRESLPNASFPLASAVLMEKQLEEKSYAITTLDELHEMQRRFIDFAKKNYLYLQHSDRLTALINQSYMMLEYVDYFSAIDEEIQDKKLRLQKANQLFGDEVRQQTQMWLDSLHDFLPGNTVLSACVNAYYNRGMLGKAFEIVRQFQDKAVCEGGQEQLPLPLPEDFDIVKGDGLTSLKTKALRSDKFLIVVDDDCIFSKIFAIMKARELEKDSRPVIIFPKGKLTGNMLAMNKLCVKDLYFIKDKTPFHIPDEQSLSAPSLYLLDANNNLKK